MRTATIVLLAGLWLLAACSPTVVGTSGASLVTSQAPLSTGYLLSTQPTMQSMAHWDHLAATVAANCARALDHFDPQGALRVYVAPVGATLFAKSYREALLTRLVDHGVPVTFAPEGAAILETGTLVVTHRRVLDTTTTGRRLVIEPGFVQTRDAQGTYQPVPLVPEESGSIDKPTPNTEIQINSALIHQGAYLYRDSSIFYVQTKDWAHYQTQAPAGEIELKRFTLVRQ